MRRSSSLGSIAGSAARASVGSASRIPTALKGQASRSRASNVRTPASAYSGSAARHRPSSLSRLSTGSQSGASRYEKKDLVTLQDKNVMKDSISRLVKFLETHRFSPPITNKALLVPTRKDFVRVYEFLVSFVNFEWKLGMKFEEEIPIQLKLLQCPYVPSRLAFLNIGAKQNWAVALAALDWLVTAANILENEYEEVELFPDQIFQMGRIINQSKLVMYEEYMAGEDDLSPYLRDCRGKLLALCNTEDFTEEIEATDLEIQKLREQVKIKQGAAEQVEKIKVFSQQLYTYCNQMKEINKSYRNTQTSKEQELAERVNAVEEVKRRIAVLQERIAGQEMSVEDAENHMMDMQRQRRLVASLEQDNDKLDKEGYDLQITQAKLREKLDNLEGTANRLLHKLPVDIKQEMGLEFGGGDEPVGLSHVDKRTIERVSRHVYESTLQLQNINAQKKSVEEQLGDQIAIQRQQQGSLENQLRRQQQETAFRKQEREQDLQAIRARVDVLEDDIAKLRQGSSMSLDQKECTIQTMQAELAQMKREYEERETADMSFIEKAGNMMLDYNRKQMERFKCLMAEFELKMNC